MNSDLLRLNHADWLKGLVVCVLAAVFTSLAQALNAPGFDFHTFDWGEVVRVAFAATAAYLGKNLLTSSDGKVLGMSVDK